MITKQIDRKILSKFRKNLFLKHLKRRPLIISRPNIQLDQVTFLPYLPSMIPKNNLDLFCYKLNHKNGRQVLRP